MARPVLKLPPEIWSLVFGYLSEEDKYSVRACSKFFRKLADHRSLWKDWSVVLGLRDSPYNGGFWASLRRREVASVLLRGSKAKAWEQAAALLPSLRTAVVEHCACAQLCSLEDVPNLTRLAFRSSRVHLLPDAAPGGRGPRQLTQLSMCDVTFPGAGANGLLFALAQLTNLTSLVCHHLGLSEDTTWMLHSILSCLPKLQHLSLAIGQPGALRPLHRPSPDRAAVLSSLELIDCVGNALPADLMRLTPGLKTLAVFHRHQDMPRSRPAAADSHHLRAWLRELPRLSALVVAKGPPVRKYAASIPATVTRLTLCVAGLSSEDVAVVAGRVPDLLHLHIDPWPSHLAGPTAQIPQLFPKLRSLKLRCDHVPERDLLQLRRLRDLRSLEILDGQTFTADKLRGLERPGLRVTTSRRRRDVWSCPCVSQVY
ncbi:hypothetical protein EYF80_060886 [Liparis tanakae]|uniref:F-box domain-containing protein n=1 Tax=Liparis tanakae TaxID=230148 RepID=A0A4Z2EJ44_9TELE|nr:hypothetical protein EYF80_060886 [Liparis tanakae]